MLCIVLCVGLMGCSTTHRLQPRAKPPAEETERACLEQPSAPCLREVAFEVAGRIANPVVRDELMLRIAANQLLNADLRAGLRSATRIRDLAQRYALLQRVHAELIDTAPTLADELREEANRLNRTHLPYNRAVGDFYITRMSITRLRHQNNVSTAKIITLVDDYLRRYARDPERLRAQFAVSLFRDDVRDSAFTLADSLTQVYWRSFAYAHFAKRANESPRLTAAIDRLMHKVAPDTSVGALQQLVTALAHQSRFEDAGRIAGLIPHLYYRAQALADIATIAARQLRPVLSHSLWQQALSLAPQADAQRPRGEALANPPVAILVAEAQKQLAVAYAKTGRFQAALEEAASIAALSPVVSDAAYARLVSEMALQDEFALARRTAKHIVGRQKRQLSLANVAIRLHANGRRDRAFGLLFSLDDRAALDHGLGEIALLVAEQGDWEQARLLSQKIRLAFKYADTLNRLSTVLSRALPNGPLALATPTHMRIIRPFVSTRS